MSRSLLKKISRVQTVLSTVSGKKISGVQTVLSTVSEREKHMNTQAQLSRLDRENEHHHLTEILHWDGRLDNRGDLLLLLADSLPKAPAGRGRGETSNAALARCAYERWGTDGFVKLIGDWSLVIHDHVNRSIVLASDFAGVRPLYYCVQSGQVQWSSRLQSLVEATGISELDEQFGILCLRKRRVL